MTTVPGTLQSALARRYELEGVLGRGGMATVYLARDLKHKRPVAVKVLLPELAATLGVDRFLAEIEIAARLNHPHILSLYDSGDADGHLYYVMPLVEGESVRDLLNRERRFGLEPATAIVRNVGDAIGYAHQRGVLHRDIKPENILMAHGHALVADFGIAKALSTAGGANLTRTGFPLGTPGYMSPEQALGSTDLDTTTDVFSLACVLYEMLVGDTPTKWTTESVVRSGRFDDVPPAHRQHLDRVPRHVEAALVRATALEPEQRFASVAAFVDAVRQPDAFGAGKTQYTDDTALRIVERAAQIQAEAPTAGDPMTIGGVERLGAEVGIPPSDVRSAARQVAGPPLPQEHSFFLGAPTTIVVERLVEGELDAQDLEEIVGEVDATLGRVGHTLTVGRSTTWTARPPQRPPGEGVEIGDIFGSMFEEDPPKIEVRITSKRGKTTIRAEEAVGGVAGGFFGGFMGGLGGSATIVFTVFAATSIMPSQEAVALILALLGGSWGIARTSFRAFARRRRAKLQLLVERLVEHIDDIFSDDR